MAWVGKEAGLQSDVVGGFVRYRFEYVEPFEGKNFSEGSGKGLLKFADPGVGWRIGTFTAKDAGGVEWMWITQLAFCASEVAIGISTRKPGAQLMWGRLFCELKNGQDPSPLRKWFGQWSGPNVEVEADAPPNVGGWRRNGSWNVWLGGDARRIVWNETPDLELWVPDYVASR